MIDRLYFFSPKDSTGKKERKEIKELFPVNEYYMLERRQSSWAAAAGHRRRGETEMQVGSKWIVHQDVKLVVHILPNMLFRNTDRSGLQYSRY